MEFGLRRAQGPDGGVSASRYAYMGGFDSTSNVLSGVLWNIQTQGTHAHSFVQSFFADTPLRVRHLKKKDCCLGDANGMDENDEGNFEKETFRCREELGFTETDVGELRSFISYSIAFPEGCLCLVDTYDTMNSGVPNFLCVAYALHKFGYKALGIRLDSGDLAFLSKQARKLFSEISEEVLQSLNQQGHEIDVFGVGTHLVTCQKQPALGCVYKLVELKGRKRIKLSESIDKVTIPGRKKAYRLYGTSGGPVIDLMTEASKKEEGSSAQFIDLKPKENERILCCDPFDSKKRAYITPNKVEKLLHLYLKEGRIVRKTPLLEDIKKHVLEQVGNLRTDHLRALNPTPYKVSVTEAVYRDFHHLWEQALPIRDISNLNQLSSK